MNHPFRNNTLEERRKSTPERIYIIVFEDASRGGTGEEPLVLHRFFLTEGEAVSYLLEEGHTDIQIPGYYIHPNKKEYMHAVVQEIYNYNNNKGKSYSR